MMAEWRGGAHPACNVDVLSTQRALVAVIDDDASVRESLPDLLRAFGYEARAFASAEQFLAAYGRDMPQCMILDIRLPGMSGPDLQVELARRCREIPIIYITAQTDGSLGPRLLGRGAVAFLRKPFADSTLLDALTRALAPS